MEVVKLGSLSEKFQPQSSGAPTVEEMPRPIADLAREATAGLTDPERGAFLRRLREEHPELLSGKATGEKTSEEDQDLPKDFSEGRWREMLISLLKEEAGRFMAAAASL